MWASYLALTPPLGWVLPQPGALLYLQAYAVGMVLLCGGDALHILLSFLGNLHHPCLLETVEDNRESLSKRWISSQPCAVDFFVMHWGLESLYLKHVSGNSYATRNWLCISHGCFYFQENSHNMSFRPAGRHSGNPLEALPWVAKALRRPRTQSRPFPRIKVVGLKDPHPSSALFV